MDEMTMWPVWIALGVVMFLIDNWLDRKFPCKCGRERAWYFLPQHERAGLMLGRSVWCTFWTGMFLLSLSWVMAPLFALVSTWMWRRWWFHEKDKLKKKVAKTAGVVSFNKHGKLVVVNK